MVATTRTSLKILPSAWVSQSIPLYNVVDQCLPTQQSDANQMRTDNRHPVKRCWIPAIYSGWYTLPSIPQDCVLFDYKEFHRKNPQYAHLKFVPQADMINPSSWSLASTYFGLSSCQNQNCRSGMTAFSSTRYLVGLLSTVSVTSLNTLFCTPRLPNRLWTSCIVSTLWEYMICQNW